MNWSWHNKGQQCLLTYSHPVLVQLFFLLLTTMQEFTCQCLAYASLSFKHLALPVSFFENIGQWFVQFWFLHHMMSSVMTQDSKTFPKFIIQNHVMGDEHVKPTTLAMTVEMASHQCMWSFTNTTQLVSVTAKRIPTSVLSTKVTNKPW